MSLQNLFVAKLPRNLTDADLLEIFSAYKPTSAKVMLDAATGKSKGFGFVLFATEEDGGAAYKALNKKSTRSCGHSFSLVIYPSNHDGRSATESSTALYIRNIPITVPQERVEHFLRAFGELTFIAMREDHYGSPVWVVYAEYRTVEQAKNALSKLHGNNSYFHGSAPILAKFEDTESAKKERRRRREEAQAQGANVHAPPTMSGCVFPPPRAPGDASSMDDVAGSYASTSPAAAGASAASGSHAHKAPFLTPAGHPNSMPLPFVAPQGSQDALSQYGFRPMPLSYNPMQANPFFPFGTPVDLYGTGTAFSGPAGNMGLMPPPYSGTVGDRAPGAARPLLQPTTGSTHAAGATFLQDSSAPGLMEGMQTASYGFQLPMVSTSISQLPASPQPSASHEGAVSNNALAAHASLLSPSAGAYVLHNGGQQFVLSSNVMNVVQPQTMSASLSLDARLGSTSSPTAQGSSYSAGPGGSHPVESLSGKDVDDYLNPYSSASQRQERLMSHPASDELHHAIFGNH